MFCGCQGFTKKMQFLAIKVTGEECFFFISCQTDVYHLYRLGKGIRASFDSMLDKIAIYKYAQLWFMAVNC